MAADQALENVLAGCYKNTEAFAKTFFPDLFYAEFSGLHHQIIDLVDSGAKKIAIAAPRGIGKTTVARTLVMKSILYMDVNFITYVSNSATSAELQTENIKRELLSNQDVRKTWGNVKESGFAEVPELDDTFSKASWIAFGNTLVMPRGAGQQVRGLIWGKHRPQLIIIDDLEKKDELMNPDNRRQLKDWFHSDLEKCVNRYLNDWRIIYIDTLKHEDSLLQELVDSSDWKSIVLSICDDNYKSNAPQYMSDEEIREELVSHREKGQLDTFYMEYMNLPTAKEDAAFKQEYFKYYEETDPDFIKIKDELENVVIVDPAKTVKMSSAESAVVGVGLHYRTNSIYVRDVVSGRFMPDQLYDEFFAMQDRIRATASGVEITGLEEFIKQPLENERIRRGIMYPTPIWLTARSGPIEGEKISGSQKGKTRRVAALVPFYRQGYVIHNSSCCANLEAQLLAFPRAKRWDIMDALAYIIEMMGIGERYFEGPEESEEDLEELYEELEREDDDPLTYWRTI